MVKKFLKIAGVKSEAEFYKKYPSEAAFFKAHPEAKDLKKYKQGGQQKKLKQLTSYQGDIDEMIPVAQDGFESIMGKNCRGKSWKACLGGDGGSGSGSTGYVSNAPVTSDQLTASGYEMADKKKIKQRAKQLETDFPGITADDVAMAMGDSARVQAKLWNLPNIDKNIAMYNQLKGTSINDAHRYLPYSDYFFNYYRPQITTDAQGKPVPLTVPEILSTHSSPQGYRATVNKNYKQKKGGKLPKAQFGLDPKFTQGLAQGVEDIKAGRMANQQYFNPFDVKWGQTQYPNVDIGGTSSNTQFDQYATSMTGSNAPSKGALNVSQLVDPNLLSQNNPQQKQKFDWDKAGKMAGPIGGIVSKIGKGIQANKAEKKAMLQAKQSKAVSDVSLQAASTRPEEIERKYNRPEDALVQSEQLFPTYGVGTNVLAEDGAEVTRGGIGGNPTEIQNMYNPYNLYVDLGYEPLSDSEKVKQYAYGGMQKAQFGNILSSLGQMGGESGALGKFGSAGGFDALNKGIDLIPGANNAGGQIGEGIGEAVGMIPGVGTVAKPIIKVAGKLIGAALDRKPQKTKKFNQQTMQNLNTMGLMQGAADIQSANQNFMEDGGWVSHDWQPQVIASFGGHRVSDLLKADPTMDTLRTGGHIRQNYMSSMDQFAFGGELKTHWGGYAETMSQNPYLPGSGETVMFRGQSHDESDGKGRTGIGVSYGSTGHDRYTDYAEYGTDAATDKANVEVERSEPAVQLPDETGNNNMVVYGNLKIPNQFLSEIGDPNAKGKKFKHYVRDLTKKEEKQNKIIEKNLKLIDDLDDVTTFDQMKFFSAKANIDGANMKLKQYADFKINAAAVQNAINDTAEENMLDADALAKGKYKLDKNAMKEAAKWGKSIKKAQTGTTTPVNGTRTVDANGDTFVYDSETGNWLSDADWQRKYASTINVYGPNGEVIGTVDRTTGQTIPVQQTPVPTTASTTPAAQAPQTAVTDDENRYNEIMDLYEKAKKAGKKSTAAKRLQEKFHEYYPEIAEEIILKEGKVTKKAEEMGYKDIDALKKAGRSKVLESNVDEYFGPRTEQYIAELANRRKKTPPLTRHTVTTGPATPATPAKAKEETVQAKKRSPWMDAVNQLQPLLIPTDQEAFDMAQLYPEMFAMASNQEEPVPVQLYRPQLKTPYDISLQDILNQNQADFNTAQRMVGYNPGARAQLSAEKYAANQKVLGEQFRQNQAMKAQIYGENINTLNDAQLKNLGILQDQYAKQAEAKSKTKATTQAALNSIADKIAKNKLENRTLGIYENLYNFRFDKQGRAINMNPLQQFDYTVGGASSGKMPTLPDGYEWDMTPRPVRKKKETTEESRNGRLVKAFKNF